MYIVCSRVLNAIEVTMENHRIVNEDTATFSANRNGDFYEFRIEGQLSPTWSDWFGGLTLTNLQDGQFILSGPIRDQAALHGILARIRDLNLKLILVRKVG